MAPDLDCLSPAHVMEGYLKKFKGSKRYFVLREGPPPRLEYYESYKSYARSGKPKRIIHLKDAWNIDKKVSSKHKHLIGIYTEKEYFAMAADNNTYQESWVTALQKAVFAYKGQSNGLFAMYKHIWQGNVDTKDLENCNTTTRINLHGLHRCCLTEKTMVFVRVNEQGASELSTHNHVEITIASIRSCGHKDNLFFMQPGRSSGIGTGKLWMELDDVSIADNMHKTILALWKFAEDDSRQRSYSFGSSTGRPSNNRSRHYYNPPPSQVGLGKPASTSALPKPVYNPASRDRCESFPATQAVALTDEARYRTSSEGETTMKRLYPFHRLRWRGERGSISPVTRSRVFSHGKWPLHLQPALLHYRTSSLPGSYTSSNNSSIEHINVSQDCSQNGQSPATSEGRGSSDEFSCSPFSEVNAQIQLRHFLEGPYSFGSPCEMAPPPPSVAPKTTPILTNASTPSSTTQGSEYASMQPSHSRSHSLDDNLSCGTGASSLSTSPQVLSDLPGGLYLYSYSPSQSSSHSQFSDGGSNYTPALTSPDDYALMSPGGASDVYPHEKSPAGDHLSADYTHMTPGRGAAGSTPTEDKSGYVPMRPLVRSQPQDISGSRRRSLSDNRPMNGSYSPASPMSRSPDKSHHLGRTCMKCKRELPHSYPSHCGSMAVTAARIPSIPAGSIHGLKVEMKNDSNFDAGNRVTHKSHNSKSSRHRDQPPVNYSDDYASVNGLARNLTAGVNLRSKSNDTLKDPKDFPPHGDTEMDHEYLPMSPMNAGNSKKSVVGNVLSIVESAAKQNSPGGHVGAAKYPHQYNVSQPGHYSTNSLGRESKQPRRRTMSLLGTALSGQRHTTHSSKHGRKHSSIKITKAKSTSSSTPAGSSSSPPQSPGGEYVSLSFDKAKRQVGPNYVSLTEASSSEVSRAADETHVISNHCDQRIGTPKAMHDSNRNLLPAKLSPPKDDHTSIKPGET